MASNGRTHRDPTPTWVYRAYAADGTLLYIGMTVSPTGRLSAHRSTSEWMNLAARFSWQLYPTRGAAHVAEMAAIEADEPAHNLYPLYSRSDKGVPRGEGGRKRGGGLDPYSPIFGQRND